jgi:hypothetical protein
MKSEASSCGFAKEMPDEGRVQYSQRGSPVPSSLFWKFLADRMACARFHGVFEDSRTEHITASEEPKKIDLSRAE